MEKYPFFDLTASWLPTIAIGSFAELGGGISLCRIIQNNSTLTQKEIAVNMYLENKRLSTAGDTIGDTAYYSFKGTKLMGRFSIDPKRFLWSGFRSRCKAEDGKVFAEIAVLGVENQGDYYQKIIERIPVMFGINIPTFGVLSVLSCQFEYYETPYPNDYGTQLRYAQEGIPIPTTGQGDYTVAKGSYKHDNWKWSVYARRFFGNNFALVGQVSRDHWRTNTFDKSYKETEEALTSPKDWYWAIKAVSVF